MGADADRYAAARNQAAVKFFDWALKNGQADAEKLDYVPLPEAW